MIGLAVKGLFWNLVLETVPSKIQNWGVAFSKTDAEKAMEQLDHPNYFLLK